VQLASHAPVHVASQSICADADPVQLPLHETSSVPPSHVGGLADAEQLPLTSQLASQFAVAVTDAWQTGGTTVSETLPAACTLAVTLVAALPHQKFRRSTPVFPFAPASFGSAPRSVEMFMHALVTSASAVPATADMSPVAFAKASSCPLIEASPPKSTPDMSVPG
jgi:hypothetical protein